MARKIKERVLSGTKDLTMELYELDHAALSRRAAAEGMVLLKNEGGLLPLKKGSKVALFGSGAAVTIKGGTGSGDVNERRNILIYEGLAESGFEITSKDWIEDYRRIYNDARNAWRDRIRKIVKEQGIFIFFAYAENPFVFPAGPAITKTDADTAVFVLARVAGEGKDRKAEGGDYYLSGEEKELVAQTCALYKNVVVIINAGSIVDLGFTDEFPQIKAVLYAMQPGQEAGYAVADVLSGDVVPSGRLTDTWALSYTDYPASAAFSGNDGDTLHEVYKEGIFVGYRYFDSFDIPVKYSFGHGLSYTQFTTEFEGLTFGSEGRVCVKAKVTNTGSTYAGREVVQLYAGLPKGTLVKEYRRLVAFAKTSALAPGESCMVRLLFGPDELASFDKANRAYAVEKGGYLLYLGGSLADAKPAAVLKLERDHYLKFVEEICPLQQEIEELQPEDAVRAAHFAAMEAAAENVPSFEYDLSGLPSWFVNYDWKEQEDEAAELVAGLSDEKLAALACGEPAKGQGSALGAAGISVPGSAAETSSIAAEDGVAPVVLADGPAGLRLTRSYHVKDGQIARLPLEASMDGGFMYDGPAPEGEEYFQFCTAFPIGTLLAQTWDEELVEEIGKAVAEEMNLFHVTFWLAPGMNIHRDPLCGRNFEYYSEDPFIAGKTAAAMARGVQSRPGCFTTIKHYACNNQEDDRMASDSILSERALREIYLRGFGIAIREGGTKSIMTSYNRINGIHAANNYDLCMKYTRCENGFDGAIMTDWTTTETGDECCAAGCMRAGNDLVMPGQYADRENILAALADGTLDRKALTDCITRVVRLIFLSDAYE
ncbi:MAG: glycoside hydrolase family 3 C-terminal domain-containing protein [Eubacterium sp.]|nr:glycoside hydrolase family 3 C-terminal domain-containing protein [Eubacterium sp.]